MWVSPREALFLAPDADPAVVPILRATLLRLGMPAVDPPPAVTALLREALGTLHSGSRVTRVTRLTAVAVAGDGNTRPHHPLRDNLLKAGKRSFPDVFFFSENCHRCSKPISGELITFVICPHTL